MELGPKCSMESCPFCTFSLTTRNFMSMCFDFAVLLLLLENNTADLLSQYILSGLSIPSTIRSPVTKFLSHVA
ncbi:hypothetical protein Lalb_Chr05g0226771 [Lupinus albus]|uniref:Uncharacterized protein n=1 Tax=Lupinus albus TaxID=3870 RepID=A0A6A4QK40_LUPAL|nr:hypothetical protein Lalb_Chr05g0226771 [Lupinus albus]